MRPIDADALPLTDIVLDNGLIPDDGRVLELPPTVRAVLFSDLNRAPAIDVKPAGHAHWIQANGLFCRHIVECSQCGNFLDMRGVNAGRGDANYCPNCGAKMDDYVV